LDDAKAVNLVAQRLLILKGAEGDTPVEIRIRGPQQRKIGDYVFRLEIDGLTAPVRRAVYGVDSLQALLLTLEALRQALAEYKGRLRCDGLPDEDLPVLYLYRGIIQNDELIDKIEGMLAANCEAQTQRSLQKLRDLGRHDLIKKFERFKRDSEQKEP
jgi:hypothetical protein